MKNIITNILSITLCGYAVYRLTYKKELLDFIYNGIPILIVFLTYLI